MSRYLGSRIATGFLDPANIIAPGNWTASFQASDFRIQLPRFLIKHISLLGPSGSSCRVYIDTTYFDATIRGDLNSWDPAQPLALHAGQAVYFYWDKATTGTIPQVSVFCYTDALI